MTHLKRATEENIIRTWARKQQEMTQYHCQPVANVEGERVTNTLVSLLLPSDLLLVLSISFPHSSVGQESACNVGNLGSVPGLGRSPGDRKGSPLQYSGLENCLDGIVHGVAESRTRLSDFHFQTHRSVEQNRVYKYTCANMLNWFLTKCKDNWIGKVAVFSTKGARTTWHPFANKETNKKIDLNL